MRPSELKEYLQKKGTVEVLVEIGTGTATFQDIQEAVLVSKTTASNRLSEGAELGLVDITQLPTDYGTEKRYELTMLGKAVFGEIQELDLEKTIRKLQRVQRKRDAGIDHLTDNVTNNMVVMETLEFENADIDPLAVDVETEDLDPETSMVPDPDEIVELRKEGESQPEEDLS